MTHGVRGRNTLEQYGKIVDGPKQQQFWKDVPTFFKTCQYSILNDLGKQSSLTTFSDVPNHIFEEFGNFYDVPNSILKDLGMRLTPFVRAWTTFLKYNLGKQ